jgi:hypothetical protein
VIAATLSVTILLVSVGCQAKHHARAFEEFESRMAEISAMSPSEVDDNGVADGFDRLKDKLLRGAKPLSCIHCK